MTTSHQRAIVAWAKRRSREEWPRTSAGWRQLAARASDELGFRISGEMLRAQVWILLRPDEGPKRRTRPATGQKGAER